MAAPKRKVARKPAAAGFHPCSGTSNPALSIDEIAAVALTAGFDPNNSITIGPLHASSAQWIVACAMKESRGHICARNHNTNGSIDRGILQWNDRAHPDINDDCAFDPHCAFAQAFTKTRSGQDFSPWFFGVTKPAMIAAAGAFLPAAQSAIDKSHATGFESAAKKTGDIVDSVGHAIGALVELLGALFKGATWVRAFEGIGGIFLIILGIVLISRDLGLSNVEEAAKKIPGTSQGLKFADEMRKVVSNARS